MHYEIIDRHTNARVGQPYKDRARARRRVDRLDNEYGAYRYFVQAIDHGAAQPLLFRFQAGGKKSLAL